MGEAHRAAPPGSSRFLCASRADGGVAMQQQLTDGEVAVELLLTVGALLIVAYVVAWSSTSSWRTAARSRPSPGSSSSSSSRSSASWSTASSGMAGAPSARRSELARQELGQRVPARSQADSSTGSKSTSTASRANGRPPFARSSCGWWIAIPAQSSPAATRSRSSRTPARNTRACWPTSARPGATSTSTTTSGPRTASRSR